MSGIIAEIPAWALFSALLVTLFAGFVKGAVGFAMPMIMISGMGSFLPPETALAALILPTVAANLLQALRQGWRQAWGAVRRFRLFLIALLVFLMCSAQLVRLLPPGALHLVIGIPVVAFSLTQLAGWRPRLNPENHLRDEVLIGSFAGFIGGMSGVWGPPTVAYLTAIDTPKTEQMRVQGVIYGVGAVALLLAHLQSGVLNAHTLPLSAMMLIPALLGLLVGFWLHDRMPQTTFRRATLVVLVLAGLNLMRRGLLG